MKPRIGVGHRCGGVIAECESSGFVVGRAEAVATRVSGDNGKRGLAGGDRLEVRTDQYLVWVAAGERQCDILGRFIHRVPQQIVLGGRIDRYEAARDSVLVGLGRQRHMTCRVAAGFSTDATHGDDNLLIVHAAEVIERIDIGDLLEELRFGIGTGGCQAGNGDLKMEVTEPMVDVVVTPFDEQRGGLKIVDRRVKSGDGRRGIRMVGFDRRCTIRLAPMR